MTQCTCKQCRDEWRDSEQEQTEAFWREQAAIIAGLQEELARTLRRHRGDLDPHEVESLATAAKTLADAWLQAEGWTD